jgi:hypothetical protein
MRARAWILNFVGIAAMVAAIVSCGDDGGNPGGNGDGGINGDGDITGDGGITDAPACTGICGDAPPTGGMCEAGNPQCSNCIDDDGDGFADGEDIECSGSNDNDEGSFSTGIPGDNKDDVMQDCFFDGNSGAGDDGCNIHVCCLLGAMSKAECPIGANKYEPSQCPPPIGTGTISQTCKDYCGSLTPPGCDCLGCCTICDPAFPNDPSKCYDIITNPNVSPNCNETNLADPTACKRCEKLTDCGNTQCSQSDPPPPPGDPAHCALCPGQDPNTLPDDCTPVGHVLMSLQSAGSVLGS